MDSSIPRQHPLGIGSDVTLEEKMALQTLLIDEMSRHQQDAPTLLIDALLADQGFAFLHHLISQRARQAQEAVQATTQLLKAVRALHQTEPAPITEDVA